ncbi:MAG: peptidylprolyl isomerase [Flavobacteriales bacterium]|nr:peptidylprolyl isomerase [Flavobacteriales bacterium]
MSTLGNIRKRSTLLLSVIGIAMLAFILGDFMQSKRSGGGGGFFVGEVAGEEIPIQAFEERVQKGTENWKNSNPNSTINQGTLSQIRNSIWDEYIRELIFNTEFEMLGVDVDSEEMFELFQGNNVHPEISKIQIFQDPITKQFDRAKMIQYMKNLENDQNGQAREQWLGYEKYIRNLRKNDKYNNLVKQGMYVSSMEAQLNFNQANENISFEYVSVPYNHISDGLVDVSEVEIKDYYKSHLNDFQQNESRDVDYVAFTVVPSKKDDEDTKNNLVNLSKNFSTYDDYEVFVKRNSDNFNTIFNFTKKDDIVDTNTTTLFTAKKGTVIGPYNFTEGTYRVAKLVDIQYRPDSVQARHILISPDENKDLDSTNALVESVKKEIESGKDFADLAQIYSIDKTTAIKGGDLGWFKEGAMVAEFNEVCFTANKGDLTIVQSQFGVHLIEVTKKSRNTKKVKIAYIDRIVEPSSETYHSYYTQAAQFARTLLDSDTATFNGVVSANPSLVKRNEYKVIPSKQNISGLENSRTMIKWMQNATVDQVSEVFEFGNNYVVAVLTKINEEGDVPLEDLKEEIESKVRKQKKGKMIVDEIKLEQFSTLQELATKMNSQVKIAEKVNFLSNQIQNLGIEPDLVGLACASGKEEITNPIIGRNAIFVLKVINRNERLSSGDFSQQQQQMMSTLKQNAAIAAFNVLKENAKIVDNRNNFY